MPFATPIVPMPRWSTLVGCTKLFLTVVVLAFVAACAVIWGSYPAFIISLFTASLSLVTFGYYMVALSFRPAVYNKWLILSIETTLTLLWFTSLILMAGWTGASSGIPDCYYNLRPYPIKTTADLSVRDLHRRDTTLPSWESSRLCERASSTHRTMVKHHGANGHYATQILAGIAAGLAGIIFILYGTTTATFAMNFHKAPSDPEITGLAPATRDDEAQTQTISPQTTPRMQPQSETHPPPLRSNSTHDADVSAVSPTTIPPSLTSSLRIGTFPKDFEPHQQKRTYYSTTEEASEAGIEPQTPILRAMVAGKKEEGNSVVGTEGRKEDDKKTDNPVDLNAVRPFHSEEVEWAGTKNVKEDGRIEREI